MFGYRGASLLFPFFMYPKKIPLFLTLHSQDLPRRGGRLWRPLQVLPYDGLIFYSKQFHDRIFRWFPRRAERFLVQGFPSNILRPNDPSNQAPLAKIRTGFTHAQFLMTYFGHISAGRGIEDLLDVMKTFKVQYPGLHLILMSQFKPEEDDYQRKLLEWIRLNGMEKKISFTGRLSNEEVSRFLLASDICVLPFPDGASFKNGSLSAAIEHSLPVLTTVSPLTEPQLLASGALLTYDPAQKSQLSPLLAHLIDQPQSLAQLKIKAAAFRDELSWNKYIENRIHFYNRISLKRVGRTQVPSHVANPK
mgnify:FL=1